MTGGLSGPRSYAPVARGRETYDVRPNNPTLIWRQSLWHLGYMLAFDLTVAQREGRLSDALLKLRRSNPRVHIRFLQAAERSMICSAGCRLGVAGEPR